MADFEAEQWEAARLTRAYMDDLDFIEQQYQVPMLNELLTEDEVVGAARLIEQPSFDVERLHTFAFSCDRVVVTSVKGATSLWYSIPQYHHVNYSPELTKAPSIPFVVENAIRRSATILLSDPRIPIVFASWDTLLAAANVAPSCSTLTFDGVGYRHRIQDRVVAINAEWSNPSGLEHPAQIQLLVAYFKLLEVADLFPEEREAAERRRLRKSRKRQASKKRKEERRKS